MRPKFTDMARYPNGYKPSHETNIRETFDRVRREQEAIKEEQRRKCEQLPRKKANG